MVFGEILEPSTRALCEDFSEYAENFECNLQWDVAEIPATIENVYIGETARIESILSKCVIGRIKKLAILTPGNVQIYKLPDKNDFIAVCNPSDVLPGLIVEKLSLWLNLAKRVFVITSGLKTSLQNCFDNSPCVIRSLHYKTTSTCLRLEVPNMITGLSASILSYCTHICHPCSLFVGYFDEVSLDSTNTRPIINLIQQLGLNLIKQYELKFSSDFNNLYV